MGTEHKGIGHRQAPASELPQRKAAPAGRQCSTAPNAAAVGSADARTGNARIHTRTPEQAFDRNYAARYASSITCR